MKRYYVLASIKPTADCLAHYAKKGWLDNTADGDHRLAWELMAGNPDRRRNFVFRVSSRSPFSVEMMTPQPPSGQFPNWEIEAREVELEPAVGTVLDISSMAVLLKSSRPGKLDGRGKKHDLVSSHLHDLRSGKAIPEFDKLTKDSTRGEIADKVTRMWVARASARLGFKLVLDWKGEPCIHAEESAGSREAGYCAPNIPSLRAVDIHARVEVTDAVAFACMLANGIGSAKAYGYGMVTAARPSSY